MDTDIKTLRRIKNLLDMAGDTSSPNEALIAAKFARALMDKHQISKGDLAFNENTQFGTADGGFRPPNKPTWMLKIAAAVGLLNDCQSVIVSAWTDITFQFRGFKSDVIISKYTHDYLIETCNRLLKKQRLTGRSNKNYYRLGFAVEISRKIEIVVKERQSELVSSSGKSLVIIKRDLVDAHFNILKPTKPATVRKPSLSETEAAERGASDASTVSLDRQVQQDDMDLLPCN